MEIDRNRFQRKTGISRGSSSYVSSGSWQAGTTSAAQPVQAVAEKQYVPVQPTVSPPSPPPQRQATPVADPPPQKVHVQVAAPVTERAHPAPQRPARTLFDDEENGFDQWAGALGQGSERELVASTPPQDIPSPPAKPKRARKRGISSFKKAVLYSMGVVVLFCLSIGAGMLSGSRGGQGAPPQGGQDNNVAAAQSTNGGNNAGAAAAALSVSPASGTLQGQTQSAGGIDAQQYSDSYKGGKINVTIQQQPDNFKSDPAQALKKFAADLKATGTVQTANRGTAYVLTTSDVQVLVFVANTKLVILQSFAQHTTDDWKAYIDNLKV